MKGLRQTLVGLVVWGTVVLAAAGLGPALRGPVAAAAAMPVFALLFLVSSLGLLWGWHGWRPREGVLAAAMVAALILALAAVRCLEPSVLRVIVHAPLLTLAAYGLARLLTARIERSWHIGAAAVVGLLADLWSVFSPSGVTNQIVSGAPEVLDYLLLAFPFPGGGIRPVLGVADYAFFAICVLHAERFEWPVAPTVQWLTAALAVTMALAGGLGVGLPALPALGGVFLVLHGRRIVTAFLEDWRA